MHLAPLRTALLLQTDPQAEAPPRHQDQELRLCVEGDECLLTCCVILLVLFL